MPPLSESLYQTKVELILSAAAATHPKGNSHLKVGFKQSRRREQTDDEKVAAPSAKRTPEAQEYSNPARCLFDRKQKQDVHENVSYMQKRYSFFLPDKQYLVDLPGLIRHLGKKVYERNVCLCCDRRFGSVEATQTHMISKGHTHIGTDTEESTAEIEDFYDYSTSYLELRPATLLPSSSSSSASSSSSNAPKMIHPPPSNEDTHFSEGNSEGEWEDVVDNEGSSKDDDGEEHEKYDRYAVPQEKFRRRLRDEYGLTPARVTEFGNLRLPNGKQVGNRAFAYVYKQWLLPSRRRAALEAVEAENKLRCKALQETASLESAQMRGLVPINQKEATTFRRKLQRDQMRLGVKGNKLHKYIRRREKFFL